MANIQAVVWRFVRYSSVGFVTFLADLGIVYILFFSLGFGYLSATALGYLLATIAAFFLNRVWTYRTHTHIWRIIYALCVAFASLVMITWITYLGVEYLGLQYLVARSLAAIVTTVFSYIADSLLTFQVPPFDPTEND